MPEARYSTTAGSEGDSEAGNAAGSLGKYMATNGPSDGVTGNLFPAITGSQAAVGVTLYRCVFILNDEAETWLNVAVWLASETAGGGSVAIGLDPAGIVAHDDSTAQAAEIADGTTAPDGVTFSAPTTEGTALVAGDVDEDECFAVWLRLTVPPGTAAVNPDGVVLRAMGDI